MSQPRIAHITTVDMSLHYLLLNQLRSLRDAGYEVVGISSGGSEVSTIEAAGIRHIPVRMTRRLFTPFQDLKALWILYRIFRSERFTIVHTHTPKAGILGRWAAKLAGVPIIVHTHHGFIFHERSSWLWRYFFIVLEKIAAQCSDLMFSVNQEDIEMAVREGICEPQKIMLLGKSGIGIDLASFDPDRFSTDDLACKRLEVGLSDGARVVGFVGRLAAKRKGFLDFLKAGQEVVKQCQDVRFLIVGDPDYGKPDAVEPSTAKRYGLWEYCLFIGQRPNSELPGLYALMDVFVLPSPFEGIPRTVMEASAMRVPAIVTDVKGNREVVEHGRNGLLVPLGDVQALANAIVELLTNREKARRMGEEGRRMALERFDERLVFEKVKAEYARLLREKGLPVPEPRPSPDEVHY